MASKKREAGLKAAKERKQKKIAVIGGVLLLALLAVQVPRTMKMLGSGDSAQASPPPAEIAPASETPPPPGATPSLEPPSLAGGPAPAEAAPVAPAAAEGQLVSFSLFESKDPFAPQIVPRAAGAEQPAAGGGESGGTKAEAGPAPGEGESTAPVAAPTTAAIAVNGVEESVALDAEFPAEEPLFRLVKLGRRSAEIAVAGGSYASGDPTVRLELGKELTLVNTADGQRFVLVLRSVT